MTSFYYIGASIKTHKTLFMKKSLYFIGALILSVSLTSCYDFNREQEEKDAESRGKQILLEAESSKKAKIEEAKAEKESAQLEADARIIKADGLAKSQIIQARGNAESIKVISESLKGNEMYLRYLMLNGMNNSNNKIYIPTEAQMPILEAK